MEEERITDIVDEVEAQLEALGVHTLFRQSATERILGEIVEAFGYQHHHQEEVEEARRRLKRKGD